MSAGIHTFPGKRLMESRTRRLCGNVMNVATEIITTRADALSAACG